MRMPTHLPTIQNILSNDRRSLLLGHKFTVNIVGSPNTSITEPFNDVEMLANLVSIPPQSLQMATQNSGGGIEFITPNSVDFGDLGISFYNTGYEYACIKGLMDLMFNPERNTFGYRNECVVNIEVSEFDNSNEIIGVYAFFDCLLQNLGEKTLSHANGESVETFNTSWDIGRFVYRSIFNNVYNPTRI